MRTMACGCNPAAPSGVAPGAERSDEKMCTTMKNVPKKRDAARV